MHQDAWERERVPTSPVGQPEVPLAVEPLEPQPPPVERRRVLLPVALFAATCGTTYAVGGFAYAGPLMLILLSHELGHFVQALRYRVPASLPYFIPMAAPLGTMGAVISMRGNMGNRKALFDIGISGPLAGLVPTVIFCVLGLSRSHFGDPPTPGADGGPWILGEPLVFKYLAVWVLGPAPANQELYLDPMAYAGWVGIFITALNLIPIGQLDGGHVLYALLRRKAHAIATLLLLAAMVGMIVTQNYQWLLMLMLLALIGPNHPPTGDDRMSLGTTRTILGWLTLSFVLVGFTPTPFTVG